MGQHISDGTPIAECASFLDQFERVAAVGVNCTAPRFIPSLIDEIRAVTELSRSLFTLIPARPMMWRSDRWVGESDARRIRDDEPRVAQAGRGLYWRLLPNDTGAYPTNSRSFSRAAAAVG